MSKIVFANFSTRNNPKYSISTVAVATGSKIEVSKKPLSQEAADHIESIGHKYDLLKKSGIASQIRIVEPTKATKNEFVTPYISGETLEQRLFGFLADGRLDLFKFELGKFISALEKLSSQETKPQKGAKSGLALDFSNGSWSNGFISPGIIDMNFDNIIIDESNNWNLIDYEWCEDYPVPFDYVLGRALYWFFARIVEPMKILAQKYECTLFSDSLILPTEVFKEHKQIFDNFKEIAEVENQFQKATNLAFAKKLNFTSNSSSYAFVPVLDHESHARLRHEHNLSLTHIANIEKANSDLNRDIEQVKNNKGYKLSNKIKSIGGKTSNN